MVLEQLRGGRLATTTSRPEKIIFYSCPVPAARRSSSRAANFFSVFQSQRFHAWGYLRFMEALRASVALRVASLL